MILMMFHSMGNYSNQFLKNVSKVISNECSNLNIKAGFLFLSCYNCSLSSFKTLLVLIDGMDNENDHSVRIISPNQEDRLEVVTYLLQFDQSVCSNVNSSTANGTSATNKLQKLLRDLNEPILSKSLIQTAAVNFKEKVTS